MKGFLRRLLGLFLLAILLPLSVMQVFTWLIRGRGSKRLDKFLEWVLFDLLK